MAAVASRYARAFADVAQSKHLNADAAMAELNSLVETFTASPELRTVWETPAVPAAQKLALLDAIAQRAGISQPVRNFVAIIIDHRRIGQLGDIARQLRLEFDARSGIAEADVTSARPLADDEKRELESRIAATTGKRVRAQYATDAKLLGGAVVRIGSTIYDGSVHGQLQRMKQELAE